MAATGIILRRKDGKNQFVGSEAPVPGELVMDLQTTNFGFLAEDGVTVKWGKLEDELPVGGTAGQILAKKTNIDGDVEWVDPPQGGGGGEVVYITETGLDGIVRSGYVFARDDRTQKSPIGNNAIDFTFIDPNAVVSGNEGISGDYAIGLGTNNSITGYANIGIGHALADDPDSEYVTILGYFNDPTSSSTIEGPVLAVGGAGFDNVTGQPIRRNIFEVGAEGNVYAPSADPANLVTTNTPFGVSPSPKVLITKEYLLNYLGQDLPTSDPLVSGALWVDVTTGNVKISVATGG